MNKLFLSLAVALVATTGFAQDCSGSSCDKSSSCKMMSCVKDVCPFGEFIKAFSDSTAYAMVDLGCPVLMISHETFEGDGQLEAIAATLYGLDKSGKIVCLGEVRSQGTLYPLAVSGNKIMTAGHHFVNKYAVSASGRSMGIVEDADVTYNTKGKASYSYENRETETYLTPKDSKRLDAMFAEFEKAKTIVFNPVR